MQKLSFQRLRLDINKKSSFYIYTSKYTCSIYINCVLIFIFDTDEKKKIVVVHTDNEEAAEEMAKRVEEAMGIKPEIYIMGPSIGAHVGPGAVACGWLSTKTRTELGL